MGFVGLRAHTAFSFGDGGTSPEALAARAASLGYGALGITDTADLGGIVRFCLEARRVDLKAIVGAELNVDTGLQLDLQARMRLGLAFPVANRVQVGASKAQAYFTFGSSF